MAIRPTVGGSDGTWGTELNAHLDISLDTDGKVDDGAVQTTSAAPGADAEIANKKYVDDVVALLTLPSGLTGGNSSNGETTIGVLEVKWGVFTTNPSSGTKTFDSLGLTDFSNAHFQVVGCHGDSTNATSNTRVHAPTTTGFNYNAHNSSSTIRFISIGR